MKTRPHFACRKILESLEARIAPASAVYTDVDEDKVTVTTSKGGQHEEDGFHGRNTATIFPNRKWRRAEPEGISLMWSRSVRIPRSA